MHVDFRNCEARLWPLHLPGKLAGSVAVSVKLTTVVADILRALANRLANRRSRSVRGSTFAASQLRWASSRGLPSVAHAQDRKRERRMEPAIGLEPMTCRLRIISRPRKH